MKNRIAAARARTDERAWVVSRRERTRQLIELGGLMVKSGLVAVTRDDRAVIYGTLLTAVAVLQSEHGTERLELWRRRGRRAFEEEAELKRTRAASDPAGTR